jgi:hypothetical protein
MASGSYTKFFNVKITNNYYIDDNGSKDMIVSPTIETQQLLKNQNMMFKADNTGFRIFYKTLAGSNSPFIPFTSLVLKFRVDLINAAEFTNFTNLNLGQTYAADNVVYITNKTTHSAATLERYSLKNARPSVFKYEFPHIAANSGDKGNIIIRNFVSGIVVTPSGTDSPPSTNITPDSNNVYTYAANLSALPKGVYEFETWTNTNTTHKIEKLYIDTEIAANRPFAIIELFFESVTTGAANNEYTMWFHRRVTPWFYKIVLKSIPNAAAVILSDTFSITDTNTGQSPYNALAFTKQANTTVNGIPTLTFLSTGGDSPIPFYEAPKRGLKFWRGATEVLTDLPGPSINIPGADFANTTGTEIFIYI